MATSPSRSPVLLWNATILPVPCSPTSRVLPCSAMPDGCFRPEANVLCPLHPNRVYRRWLKLKANLKAVQHS